MAPLASNLTARVFIEYTCVGVPHTTLIRLEATAIAADGVTIYNSFTTAAKGLLDTSDSFTGARFSAAGTNVSFPLSVSAVLGTSAIAEVNDQKATFVSVTGRSVDGRDAKIGLFTPTTTLSANEYRYTTVAGPSATFLAWFATNAAQLRSVSNSQVIWNTYLNYGVSAYWQRKLRRD